MIAQVEELKRIAMTAYPADWNQRQRITPYYTAVSSWPRVHDADWYAGSPWLMVEVQSDCTSCLSSRWIVGVEVTAERLRLHISREYESREAALAGVPDVIRDALRRSS